MGISVVAESFLIETTDSHRWNVRDNTHVRPYCPWRTMRKFEQTMPGLLSIRHTGHFPGLS